MTIDNIDGGSPESITPRSHVELGYLRQKYYLWRITKLASKLEAGAYSSYDSNFSARVSNSSSVEGSAKTIMIWEEDGIEKPNMTLNIEIFGDLYNPSVNATVDPHRKKSWEGCSLNLGTHHGTAASAEIPGIVTRALSSVSRLPKQDI